MSNKIIYGPHKDRKTPLPYIRIKEDITQEATAILAEIFNAHENIKQTLGLGFNAMNPNSAFSQLSERFDLDKDSPVKISFINYGNTELVYMIKCNEGNTFTILINQPQTPIETIRQEFENLKRLFEIDPHHVVEPYVYFSDEGGKHSFYVSEYIDNAICIAHSPDGTPGFYNPLPSYHFENIDSEIIKEVNKHIIALLVHYYDQEQGMGLGETEISGNDFMLTRNFDLNNRETIRDTIKLISARNRIKIEFEEYLNLIRKEFSIGTNRKMDDVLNGKIKINHKSIIAMTTDEIEEGIKLGLEMNKKEKLYKSKSTG